MIFSEKMAALLTDLDDECSNIIDVTMLLRFVALSNSNLGVHVIRMVDSKAVRILSRQSMHLS